METVEGRDDSPTISRETPNMAPGWPQDGSKMAPKWARKAPRRFQERPKSDQVGPRWANHGPTRLQGGL